MAHREITKCIGNDPTCPCQDGDLCHYVDDPITGTKAMEPMPEEDIDHTCMYTKDKGDRNFKYCIVCGRVKYRTNDEIMGDYNTAIKRGLDGN